MDVLTGLVGLAKHISIQHVLVLNLIGSFIKCFLHHRDLMDWTDIIPIILGVSGIALAYLDAIQYQGNFIVYGLANAGMAWLLHRIVKPIPFKEMHASVKKKLQ